MISRIGHVRGITRRLTLQPGETIDPHRHEQIQVVVPHSGVLAVTTPDGTWFVAAPDQAVLMPAGVLHGHRAQTRSVMTATMLAFPPVPHAPTDRPVVVGLTPLARHVLQALGQPERLGRQRSALENVLRYELRGECDIGQQLSLPKPRDRRLVALAGVLIRAPEDRRSVGEHARGLGMGERTLRRLIRAELGMSFPQWRNLLRLVASLTYLTNGESVNSTAYRCGFTSPSSFITQFKQFLHVTPGAYQRNLQSAAD
jgi:AraC-like DNA-binding protein/quercetin dioxygenase-like cupin family protein